MGDVDYVDLYEPLPDVSIVSGMSENHAGEGRSFVLRLAEDHPDWKLYLYDIGLTKSTRKWFQVSKVLQLSEN